MYLLWWEYLIIAISVFIGGVFLSFFVKILNEARLDERFNRLQQKTSTNRSTQVQESSPMEPISLRDDQSANSAKASTIYNKEDLKTKNSKSNLSSLDSSKENSKLKFLGTIYNNENNVSKNKDNCMTNGYNSNLNRKQSSKELVRARNDKELKIWISDLLLSHVNNNAIKNK